jgi:hypothetical protein
MNQKIQCLIDGGFITINDVLEHAGYLENQINNYYEQYAEEQQLQLDEEMKMLDELHNSGEDLYGQEEQQEQEDYPFDLSNNRSDNPEYIIASTSYKEDFEETYLFEANWKGEILNYSEYGGRANRFGHKDWNIRVLAVESVFPDKYTLFADLGETSEGSSVYQSLYKRIDNEKN